MDLSCKQELASKLSLSLSEVTREEWEYEEELENSSSISHTEIKICMIRRRKRKSFPRLTAKWESSCPIYLVSEEEREIKENLGIFLLFLGILLLHFSWEI